MLGLFTFSFSHLSLRVVAPFAFALVLTVGCAQTDLAVETSVEIVESNGTDAVIAPANFTCEPCVQRADCGSGWCVQFAADTYCAVDCTNSPCGGALVCKALITESGESVKACVPEGEACTAADPDVQPVDTAVPGTCGYDGPDTPSCCKGCSGASNCQPNGCFNSWVCDRAACKCVAFVPDNACDVSDATSEPDTSAPDVQLLDIAPGSLTPAGGAVPELFFAIVGDTRPALIEDTAGYPAAIAKKIWQGVEGSGAPFAITTGDYIFAKANGTQAVPQLDLYLGSAAAYTGLRLPALGNHECTGATTSNCGSSGKDGFTKNYTAYMTKMVEPLGFDHSWYAFHVHAEDNSWTAKFVFVAANAWDNEQAIWLDTELAKPTTYTFVVRHEPVAANTAPGVKPSELIIKKYPVTLRLVGHTHTYSYKPDTHEVVVGNGGAPLSGGVNYGYVLVKRRPDAAIEFRAIDYSTGKDFNYFAINADGSPAP